MHAHMHRHMHPHCPYTFIQYQCPCMLLNRCSKIDSAPLTGPTLPVYLSLSQSVFLSFPHPFMEEDANRTSSAST